MKRLMRVVLMGVLIIVILSTLPLIGVLAKCKPFATPAVNDNVVHDMNGITDIADEQSAEDLDHYTFRGEDQTYLTLPEWYIVFYSDEYASFIQEKSSTHFPYFRSIWQYWQIYYNVCDIIQAEEYPFNSEYQVTLAVIGVSFTAENIMRGSYETTIGRLSGWLSSDEMTAEERYASQVAEEYGDFIHLIPWYEFPFGDKLEGLWSETPWWGPNVIRKWERRFALTVEYGGKYLYGWAIRQGAGAAFSTVLLETQARVTGLSDSLLENESELRIVKEIGTESLNAEERIVGIPRYEPFTQIVPTMTEQGVRFVEIAGNDEIAITLIAPQEWAYDLAEGEQLFSLTILSQPELKRVAIILPVQSLHVVLAELDAHDVVLEHIYDY